MSSGRKKSGRKKIGRKSTSKKKSVKKRNTAAKKSGRPPKTKKNNPSNRFKNIKWRYVFIAFTIIFIFYVVYLDFEVRNRFGDKRWELGAYVYARPLELHKGSDISADRFEQELKLLNYDYSYPVKGAGTYYREGNEFYLKTRRFQFWDGVEISRSLKVDFQKNRPAYIVNLSHGAELELLRMEPVLIGGIYPLDHEDRLIIKLKDVPPMLIKILLAVEDRRYYDHIGLDFKAIARAIWTNVTGGALQGGSTVTQQLVKSYYLNNERTLWRKFNEAIMSLLLEVHYDKDVILEAYINEIYLGQDGKRAIHGFALASQFYFNKPLAKLDINELATLVALVRGPSYYHPEKHPARLKQRRDRILDTMVSQKIISQSDADKYKAQPIKVRKNRRGFIYKHPAYMDLVKRQLSAFYNESDLRSEGLRIFTTLDPVLQLETEQSVQDKVSSLDNQQGLNGNLQVATIIIDPLNAEVLALVGDRNPHNSGFNRVLDARRPIGSLIKPVIYLTALGLKNEFNWTTLLNDNKLILQSKDGKRWSPDNYDKKYHGQVSMMQAFINSYNIATVRLGMKIGYGNINRTIKSLGVDKEIPPYPSILLGTTELSPFEVAQMYQPLAASGFSSPIRAITEVVDAQGKPLERYSVQIRQALPVELVHIINTGMVQVTQKGTAKYISSQFSNTNIAGKTGTTNNKRDSWFVGYTQSHLAVVWLGTDDNKTTGLSGSAGSLRVWVEVMRHVSLQSIPVQDTQDSQIYWLERDGEKFSGTGCGDVPVGFITGTVPVGLEHCD